MSDGVLIDDERRLFHERIVEDGLLVVSNGIPSNADKDSVSSMEIATRLASILSAREGERLAAQTAGKVFENGVARFLARTFPELQQLRPGTWDVRCLGNRGHRIAEGYAQYEHLSHLKRMVESDIELRMAVGNDYIVSPDVVIARELVLDDDINVGREYVDEEYARYADIRAANGGKPILHASISVKWTIRSDRAQNSRTEALNLIRNRKGRVPHICIVTGEPLPSRLASLALGTGDIDCVYHIALNELREAVDDYSSVKGVDDSRNELESLVVTKRLKDISDLPLDLCV